MHARSASTFVQIACRYGCDASVRKGDLLVNGKSIMGVLQLAATRGQFIEIETNGEAEEEALAELGNLIDNLFGEEE